jgi:CHAT domain-containing protein/Tfp pilus assembly protein PilF
MIRPYSSPTQSRYLSVAVYCSLLLSISLPLVRIQAAPDSLCLAQGAKPDAEAVSRTQQERQSQQLEPGKQIERALAGGESHSYQMALAAGQYAKLIIHQRGIDVVARLFGPDGKQIVEFDSDIRTQGEECVELVAEEAGSYRLEVQSNYKRAADGVYDIQVMEMRSATENERALHEARKLQTEFHRLYRAGNYGEALSLAERVLVIRERVLGPEHFEVATALNSLAVLYRIKGDYVKAKPLLLRALPIREKELGPEHPAVAATLINLANLDKERGDYAKAESLYARALAIQEKALGAEHSIVAEYLNNLAVIYNVIGNYSKAEPLFLRALAIKEKALGPEHPDVGQVLNNLAKLYKDMGNYAEAESLYGRSLAIYEKTLGSDHPLVFGSLNNLALLYSFKGESAKAEQLFQRALAIKEKAVGPEHPQVATALNNLARLYQQRGDYAKAESFLGRALAISEKMLGSEHPQVAGFLHNLADLYQERGDYAKAISFYGRVLAIREKALGPEHPFVAQTLNNLAIIYTSTGDYAKAESFYGRVLAIREKALGPEHSDVAKIRNNIAGFYVSRNEYAKAEPLIQRALAIWEKQLGPDHLYTADALFNHANLYLKRGDYAKAEPLYERTLATRERVLGPNHAETAEVLSHTAMLYAAKGDIAQAITVLSRANAVEESNLSLALALGSERQKLAYLDKFSKSTNFTLSLKSEYAPNDPQALNLAFTTLLHRKARGLDAMADTIATIRRNATPQDRDLFDKLKDARSQLAALTLKDPEADRIDTDPTRVKKLKDEIDDLEGKLSSRNREFNNYKKQSQPVTLFAVQSALPANSALIEFVYFTPLDPKTEKSKPPRYLAYLLPAQGQPNWVDLGEAAPIEQAIDAWRKTLRTPYRLDVKRLARAVDEIVMRPVRARLSDMSGNANSLLVSPDGSLNLIPFAALVDEENKYLVERYSISYLTSGRDLLRFQASEPSRTPPLVVADPDFGNPATIALRGVTNSGRSRGRIQAQLQFDQTQLFFPPLPASRYEALAIKSLLPQAAVLQQERATEAALKQARGPRILHIATHGFFYNNKQESRSAEEEASRVDSERTRGLARGQSPAYTVQLEATPALETAQERAKRLRELGVDAYIVKNKVKGKGILFRVRAGNFPTQAEAQKYGAQLQRNGVVREYFVAGYRQSQAGLAEPAPMIADLRLSKFLAHVKDPLLRSGLALAGANQGKSGDDDGLLTALEAAYLDLSGTKLVVLSACNTGVGDVKNGEGVQGLRRALVLAGSESQVMSLWPVSDVAAKDLMIPYYKALQEGEGRSEGLRQVQLRMLHGRKDRHHPFYWAAFIQSGEWANLDGQR